MATVEKYKNYRIWQGMKDRCLNKKSPYYFRYGGRGITVCKEWLNFKKFNEDMGEKPLGYSLDRIDNNGNYCKENCRWASSETQNNNSRKNRRIKHQGEIKSVSQWAKYFNIKSSTFRQRFYVYKWPFEKCIINLK